MTTKGTREWAYKNLNICKGCKNNCSYCYAYRMAKRFKRVKNRKEWQEFKIKKRKIEKQYRKLNNPTHLYDYMFPTSHDIFPEILEECIIVLKKILRSGNTVLITTKANLECIMALCEELRHWKSQICFRFTITSEYRKISKRFEPYAPDPNERGTCLMHANWNGYKTSISMEPFLDKDPIPLILSEAIWVTDTIWLGIMSGRIPEDLKENYSLDNLVEIYHRCQQLPPSIKEKLRFKDSIVNKLNLSKNWIREDKFEL